jgi:DUF1680 family protein
MAIMKLREILNASISRSRNNDESNAKSVEEHLRECSDISPFAQLWLKNYPLPNAPLNTNNVNYIANVPSISNYDEYLPNSNSLKKELGELCGSAFWAFLSQHFQLMNPEEEKYAAEIEKTIYNVAMANQQDTHGLRYHTIIVGKKEEGTRKNTCCEGQGTRLIGSIPEHINSIAPDGIYVNLYEPSTIQWPQGGRTLSLQMETKFPFEKNCKNYGLA